MEAIPYFQDFVAMTRHLSILIGIAALCGLMAYPYFKCAGRVLGELLKELAILLDTEGRWLHATCYMPHLNAIQAALQFWRFEFESDD